MYSCETLCTEGLGDQLEPIYNCSVLKTCQEQLMIETREGQWNPCKRCDMIMMMTTGVNPELSFSYVGCYTKTEISSLHYYLSILDSCFPQKYKGYVIM